MVSRAIGNQKMS